MSDDADTGRLIGDVVRLGTIESVDHAEATCRVRVGDLVTGDVPWVAGRSGKSRTWSPPTLGEQGLLICAEGDTEAGIFLPGLFSTAAARPSDSASTKLSSFEHASALSYDHPSHCLPVLLPAGGTAAIEALGGVTIKGPVRIEGPVEVEGKLTASDDVEAAGISLKNHTHPGVQAGSAKTAKPV